jgi:hypothetical protein
MPPGISTQHQQSAGVGVGVGVGLVPHCGIVAQICVVQHGAPSAIRLTKKQTLSPGLAPPMIIVSVVDWPFANGEERFENCGATVNVVPPAGVRRTCDIALPELLTTLTV